MVDVLIKEYNWMSDLAYGKNQWRMGDGQTTFNNFIYYTLAGFQNSTILDQIKFAKGYLKENKH